MAQEKKYQVFISSVFDGFEKERQAALMAILTSGHIPAGMEWFAASDKRPLEIIYRWIQAADVFCLIISKRYGQVAPGSDKSYIHLEYEEAERLGKPIFTIIEKTDQFEDRPNFNELRAKAKTNIIDYWEDHKDIKIGIDKALDDFRLRDDIPGWIKVEGNINFATILANYDSLSSENINLKKQLSSLSPPIAGLQPDVLVKQLKAENIETQLSKDNQRDYDYNELAQIKEKFGDTNINMLHYFIVKRKRLNTWTSTIHSSENLLHKLVGKGLVDIKKESGGQRYMLSKDGIAFSNYITDKLLSE